MIRRVRYWIGRTGVRGPAHDLRLYTNDWGFDLRKTKAHVHLWYGSEDRNVPAGAGNLYHSLLPHNTYTVYPNEGHLIIRRHAKEILKALVR